MKNPRLFQNILMVRTDRIGDVVLTTPAIKALRQAYPMARLSILVAPATCDLVNGNPYLDEILVDDRAGRQKGFGGFLNLVWMLQSKKFDLAVIFHTKRRYNLAAALAGIPVRLGYQNDKFGFLLTHPIKDTRPQGLKHEVQYCLDLLKILGVSNKDLGLFVPIHKEAELWMHHWMKENDVKPNEFITIHPGSSDPAKCWPTANFAALIDRLSERYGMKILLIGSTQTVPMAQEIANVAKKGAGILNMTGKTSLSQMASVLRRTRLLISNDSGPVHVAAGVGISVISLFLRDQPGINPERWRPLGPKSFFLCHHPLAGRADGLKVDEVIKLVDDIFKKYGQYEIF